ncbi:allantoinase AllB [Kocuria varians]
MNDASQHGPRETTPDQAPSTPAAEKQGANRGATTPEATADPAVNEEHATERVRAKVEQAASNPERDETPRGIAQENSQLAVTEQHRAEVEAARAAQIELANEVNDAARVRELIRRYKEENRLAETDEPSEERLTWRQEGEYDLVVRGRNVSCGDTFAPREVGVRDGKIAAVEPLGTGLRGARVVELAEDETLIPGLVDTHVHVNEPGRTEWEGFATATRAAAAGGVTTIVDMPLNSVPATVNVAALEYKRLFARQNAFVDIGFWGGAVPGNKADLRPLHDDGVFGFKCFLLHSGVDEFPHLEADEMEEALAELKTFNSLLIVHAEDSRTIDRAPQPNGAVYENFLKSRPRGAENIAIAEVIERTRWTGARSHILHLSSSDAIPMIRSAKNDGLDITVETCPHYLTLLSEEIPDGATAFKCCPPVREVSNREKLWEGLIDGAIDYIVSDHSPSTLDLKDLGNGDFGVAWGGVSSLQLGLSLIWTEARRRGVGLERVLQWMSTRPAERVGLRNKGRLALGYDADMAVFAQDESYVVDAQRLNHKNPITPYQGKVLSGKVRKTFVGGREVDYETPTGRLLSRGQA